MTEFERLNEELSDAEFAISELKSQVALLSRQVETLKAENERLRGEAPQAEQGVDWGKFVFIQPPPPPPTERIVKALERIADALDQDAEARRMFGRKRIQP